MTKYLLYDQPTPVFHWLFAGLTLEFLVPLRVLWGLFGTEQTLTSGGLQRQST